MSEDPLEQRRVLLPLTAGVVAVGPYRPGEIVAVPATEADRLIRVKGFVAADDPLPMPSIRED